MRRQRRRRRHRGLAAGIRYFIRKKYRAGLRVFQKKKRKGWLYIPLLVGIFLLGAGLRSCMEGENQLPLLAEKEMITLYHSGDRTTETLDFEEYILGVVAAEMPAAFELEALKAQAVCARTYAYQRILSGYAYPGGANVSDDPGTCQAYRSYEEFAKANPQDTEMYYERLRQAVQETRGEILVCGGAPLEALYHSTCGGKTEDAASAWGEELAGLESVDCAWCTASPCYRKEKTVPLSVIARVMGVKSGEGLQITEWTASGRARKISAGGKTVSAEEFRRWLDLPSTWITLQRSGDNWIISTRGYGHGIGLCQYGAGGMAKEGFSYQEILSHYYSGAALCCIE